MPLCRSKFDPSRFALFSECPTGWEPAVTIQARVNAVALPLVLMVLAALIVREVVSA